MCGDTLELQEETEAPGAPRARGALLTTVSRAVSPPLQWVELRAPKRSVGVLTLGTGECDLIWKQDLCRYDGVKMRSYKIRVVLNPMIGVLIRRRKFGQRQREEGYVNMEAMFGGMQLQAKEQRGLLAAIGS